MGNDLSSDVDIVSSNQQDANDSSHTTLIALVLPMIILFFLTSITVACLFLKKTAYLNPILSPRRRQDPGIAWSFQIPKLHPNSKLGVRELACCSATLVIKNPCGPEGHDDIKVSDETQLEPPHRLDIGLPLSPWASNFCCSSAHVLGQSLSVSMPTTPVRSNRATMLFHKASAVQSRFREKWHLPNRLRPKPDMTENHIMPPEPAALSDNPYNNLRVTRAG
ncbi:uncharacterized protein MELLADRAFT_72554 [Melampsora larici-populina 98AG31]|uniref:Uncharacterized protein n=1 Tax=Melampsora larici-populina (strain 98AG31 / pathotype 3-4-7) TaxID=747676 RepID=F4RVU4_MELLP|nr:uncharacterized protein MELLADRAFT_72554 [Melampsora larici-populina 98AG31]EGG03522.1 hypothetical protein MELLADRAFT_72554 [Melampsora larici-populina 98AG31]